MDGQTFLALQQGNTQNPRIQFNGNDETNSFPVPRDGNALTVVESPGDHKRGSAKFTVTRNYINSGWEHRHYVGDMLCHHMTEEYLAYAGNGILNRGFVKIVNKINQARSLIRNEHRIMDLSFAHIANDLIIAFVDFVGNLYVHRIFTISDTEIANVCILQVEREEPAHGDHKLVWCPFNGSRTVVDSDEEDSENSDETQDDDANARRLALVLGNCCEVWHLDTVIDTYGCGPVLSKDVVRGKMTIVVANDLLTDAEFSPDGTTIAASTLSGRIKFYQVYMKGEEELPRQLFTWDAYTKPINSLLFVDNHLVPQTEFWKYIVTCTDQNSEIKIWSCKSWTCLQTIRFQGPPGDQRPVRLKVRLDHTARYLLLSDIDRSLLYVLTLEVESDNVRVLSVSEFMTPGPLIFLSVVSAGKKQVSMNAEGMTVIEGSSQSGSPIVPPSDAKLRTVIKLAFIHPKALQEATVVYEDPAESLSSSKEDPMIEGEGGEKAGVSGTVTTPFMPLLNAVGAVGLADEDPAVIASPNIIAHNGAAPPPADAVPSVPASMTATASTLKTSHSPARGSIVSSGQMASESASNLLATLVGKATPSSSPNIMGTMINQPPMKMTAGSETLLDLLNKPPVAGPNILDALMVGPQQKPATSSPNVLESLIAKQQQPATSSPTSLLTSLAGPASTSSPNILASLSAGSMPVTSPSVLAVLGKPATASSPKPNFGKRNSNADDLAEAASKIGMMSPKAFDPMSSTMPPPDLLVEDQEGYNSEADEDRRNDDTEDEQDSGPPKLENVLDTKATGQDGVSGCSSPSREVENILSTQDGRFNSNSMSPDPDCTLQGSSSPNEFHSPMEASLNNSGNDTLVSGDAQPSGSKEAACNLFPSSTAPSAGGSVLQLGGTGSSMEEILSVMREQIGVLQHQQQKQASLSAQRLDEMVSSKVEKALVAKVDNIVHSFNRAIQMQMQRLESSMEKKLDAMVEKAMVKVVSKCDQAISKELKKTLPNTANKAIEAMTTKIENKLHSKVLSSDAAISEGVTRMLNSQNLHDSVAKSIAKSLQPVIIDSYKNAFKNQLAPLEKTMKHMLIGVSEEFMKGTKEYEAALRSRLEASEVACIERLNPSLDNVNKNLTNNATSIKKLSGQVSQLHEKLDRDLPAALKEAVVREIKSGFSNANVPNNTSSSPAQSVQQQIQRMLSAGDYNGAFEAVLNVKDQTMLLNICEQVSSTQLFGNATCPLSQVVLLSLIQHLGVDFRNKTELRHSYISDALLFLDADCLEVRQYLGNVLTTLSTAIQFYCNANPDSNLCRPLRSLLLAANGKMAGLTSPK